MNFTSEFDRGHGHLMVMVLVTAAVRPKRYHCWQSWGWQSRPRCDKADDRHRSESHSTSRHRDVDAPGITSKQIIYHNVGAKRPLLVTSASRASQQTYGWWRDCCGWSSPQMWNQLPVTMQATSTNMPDCFKRALHIFLLRVTHSANSTSGKRSVRKEGVIAKSYTLTLRLTLWWCSLTRLTECNVTRNLS